MTDFGKTIVEAAFVWYGAGVALRAIRRWRPEQVRLVAPKDQTPRQLEALRRGDRKQRAA